MEAVATAENKTKTKSKVKVSKIAFISVLCAAAIGSGIYTGYFLHNMFSGGSTDYSTVDATALADDNAALLTKYKSVTKTGAAVDFVSEFKPYQAANISFALFLEQEHSFSQGIGAADAGAINQQIRSTIVRNGADYFEESLSYSQFVNLADRMYQSGESVNQYIGTCINGDVEKGQFPDTPTNYTLDEYRTRMGRLVSDNFIYVVSSKTTLNGEVADGSGVATSFSKNDSGYQIELELNPVKSVVNYVKQMKTISSLKDYPSFTYVHLSITTDANLNLQSVTSKEHYFATTGSGLGSWITGTMRTVYQTGQTFAIPALNEPETYREAQ
jgi:uncharacterized protein YheU (UPF0270 family)